MTICSRSDYLVRYLRIVQISDKWLDPFCKWCYIILLFEQVKTFTSYGFRGFYLCAFELTFCYSIILPLINFYFIIFGLLRLKYELNRGFQQPSFPRNLARLVIYFKNELFGELNEWKATRYALLLNFILILFPISTSIMYYHSFQNESETIAVPPQSMFVYYTIISVFTWVRYL